MFEIKLNVKAGFNCKQGYSDSFHILSPRWTGKTIVLPVPPHDNVREVVGVSINGPCNIHVVRVQTKTNDTEYLVFGGDCGVRVIDDHFGSYNHAVPPGYGMAAMLLSDDKQLRPDVKLIVNQWIH